MNGTILKPKYISTKCRERDFLLKWQEDAHTAFLELTRHGFPEFNYAGHGNDYWTVFGYLNREKIVPASELATVAITYMENNPISLKTWSTYNDILDESIQQISAWVLDNFTKISHQIEQFALQNDCKNLANSVERSFIFCLSRATDNERVQPFLQKIWYDNPYCYPESFFAGAFKVNGKYGELADKAIQHIIKACRIRIKVLRSKPDEFTQETVESLVYDLGLLIKTRYGYFEVSRLLWDKQEPSSEGALAIRSRLESIDDKVERIIVSQNARISFPCR